MIGSFIPCIVIAQESEVMGKTGPNKISPVIEAVLAQIDLNPKLFHTFMSVLRTENPVLADVLQDYYCK